MSQKECMPISRVYVCQTGIKYGCWLMDMFERQCNVITQQPDFCTDNWVEDPKERMNTKPLLLGT